jgi:plasmid stabilization system protein ParE
MEVKSAIAEIRQDPARFAHWDNIHRFCMLNKFPYYVAYRQAVESILIVAIRHASQDQDAWQDR